MMSDREGLTTGGNVFLCLDSHHTTSLSRLIASFVWTTCSTRLPNHASCYAISRLWLGVFNSPVSGLDTGLDLV